MSATPEALDAAIAALEAQRPVLGDAVVDLALAPLRAQRSATFAPDVELRTTTVVFVDVVGSTSLASTMDAEDVHELMNALAVRFTAIVTGHLGQVVKYTGDGLVAVFGVGKAQEVAAAQAIRACLGMHEAIRTASPGLQIRVGVHTGKVVIGGGIEGVANIRGQAVNIAARMEQTAPPGGLRISAETHRVVRGMFEVTADEPITVKGVDRPLQTYLVHSARDDVAQADRGIDGLEVPMVGRGGELSQLCRAVESCQTSGGFRRFVVVADAGVGKSRLLLEFERWLDRHMPSGHVLHAFAQVQTRRVPYAMLRTLLAVVAGGPSLDGLRRWLDDEQVRHLTSLVAAGPSSEPPSSEIPDAERMVTLGRRAFGSLLAALSDEDPVVVFLEDLHWADDETLDLIDHVHRVLPDLRVVVVSTARPVFLDRRPADGDVLRLDALAPDDASDLASRMLRRLDVVPRPLLDRVVTGSGGIPYFMEEIVRSMVDDATITVEATGRWSLDPSASLDEVAVPLTLVGVLQARFDALTAVQRATAQRAAVIGHVFWPDAVAALGGDVDALTALEQRDIVVREAATSRSGHDELHFRHHLLHQFVSDTILKADRRRHHGEAAAWLSALPNPGHSIEHLVAIARHHEAAGQLRDAAAGYESAAVIAEARGAPLAVVHLTTQALGVADPDDHDGRFRLVHRRASALELGDDRDQLTADLEELDRLAERIDDARASAAALHLRVRMLLDAAEHSRARTDAAQLVELARGIADLDLTVEALVLVAAACWRLGRVDEAVAAEREALRAAEGGAGDVVRARVLRTLAIQSRSGRNQALERSQAMLVEALALTRRAGDVKGEVSTLNVLGIVVNETGDGAGARGHYTETVRRAREVGWSYGEVIGTLNLAGNLCEHGNYEAAHALARQAADVAALISSRDLEGAALATLGWSAVGLGDLAGAEMAFRRCRELFVLNDSPHYELDAVAGLAYVESLRGNVDAATALARVVVEYPDLRSVADEMDYGYLTLCVAHLLLSAAGDDAAAPLISWATDEMRCRIDLLPTDVARRGFLAGHVAARHLLLGAPLVGGLVLQSTEPDRR